MSDINACPITHVIFDLGGVIVDMASVCEAVLEELAIKFNEKLPGSFKGIFEF